MIDKIKLKFGASPTAAPLEFSVTPITIFVGPNYSGKSKLIKEIAELVQHGRATSERVIADEIKLRTYSQEEAEKELHDLTLEANPGEMVHQGHILVGANGSRSQVQPSQIVHAFVNFNALPDNDHMKQILASQILRHKLRMLDGQGRIGLANDQAIGDMLAPATTSFQQLWRNDNLRSELREIVFDAFGEYLTLDPTNGGQLRLRLSRRAPANLNEEQGLTLEARTFHAEATLLSAASDGAKAFCGIMSEVMAGKPDVLLIDEPEAFLHPTLSFKLAKHVAKQMSGSNKRLFVSTHSPHFLMGCVASGVPVNVVRLTYRNRVATARILPSDELAQIMKVPLLRSSGVLSGLFYENVVMTEGDTDRAFYQEINERLLAADEPNLGIPNCLFLNANGKDQIPTIMEPLRKFGIPVAGIYDLDFIKEGGAQSSTRLRAATVPEGTRNGLNPTRVAIETSLREKHANYKRNGGLKLLDGPELETARLYLRTLAEYGVFLVPNGEVEAWLSKFGIGGKSAEWLIPMFERLGSDETLAEYVQPDDGDVWAFLGLVRNWLLDPERSGIPS
jgi:predicted ATPase